MGMGMRVSGSGAASQSGAAAWQQRQQNVQALSKALQSNDLDAAKAAYAALSSGNARAGSADPNSPFAQLGKALQSGDLGAAQQAFASLRAGRGHKGGAGDAAAPAPAGTSNPTATTGTNIDVLA